MSTLGRQMLFAMRRSQTTTTVDVAVTIPKTAFDALDLLQIRCVLRAMGMSAALRYRWAADRRRVEIVCCGPELTAIAGALQLAALNATARGEADLATDCTQSADELLRLRDSRQ